MDKNIPQVSWFPKCYPGTSWENVLEFCGLFQDMVKVSEDVANFGKNG